MALMRRREAAEGNAGRGLHDDILTNVVGRVANTTVTTVGGGRTAQNPERLPTENDRMIGLAHRFATGVATTGGTTAIRSVTADGTTTAHTPGQSGPEAGAGTLICAMTMPATKSERGNSPPCSRRHLSWTRSERRGSLHWTSRRSWHVQLMMLHVSGRPNTAATTSSRMDCTGRLAILAWQNEWDVGGEATSGTMTETS